MVLQDRIEEIEEAISFYQRKLEDLNRWKDEKELELKELLREIEEYEGLLYDKHLEYDEILAEESLEDSE